MDRTGQQLLHSTNPQPLIPVTHSLPSMHGYQTIPIEAQNYGLNIFACQVTLLPKEVASALGLISLIPKISPPPVFDRLQQKKKKDLEARNEATAGLVYFTAHNTVTGTTEEF